MTNVPPNVQREFDKRDETILVLEMLTVDQACRLLALEAVLRALLPARKKPSTARIDAYIAAAAARFQDRFEGDSIAGFTDRAKRIAAELVGS